MVFARRMTQKKLSSLEPALVVGAYNGSAERRSFEKDWVCCAVLLLVLSGVCVSRERSYLVLFALCML